MFAKTIIDSDAFLDMPLTTQALYFHLSMRADDEGFINNPKKIQRIIGASDDDFKVLITKSFIIPFETGIVVIKHWKIHNYIQNDRFKPTVYVEEKACLKEKPNKAYTLDTECIQDGYTLEAQDRVNKINIINISSKDDCSSFQEEPSSEYVYQEIVDLWNTLNEVGIAKIRKIPKDSPRVPLLRKRLKEYGNDSFELVIQEIKNSDFLQGKSQSKGRDPFNIDFDWVIKPKNYPKILEGKYRNKDYNTQQNKTVQNEHSDYETVTLDDM